MSGRNPLEVRLERFGGAASALIASRRPPRRLGERCLCWSCTLELRSLSPLVESKPEPARASLCFARAALRSLLRRSVCLTARPSSASPLTPGLELRGLAANFACCFFLRQPRESRRRRRRLGARSERPCLSASSASRNGTQRKLCNFHRGGERPRAFGGGVAAPP